MIANKIPKENIAVSIFPDRDGMYAYFFDSREDSRESGFITKLKLTANEFIEYSQALRGDPNASVTERHGCPSSRFFWELMEKARL